MLQDVLDHRADVPGVRYQNDVPAHVHRGQHGDGHPIYVEIGHTPQPGVLPFLDSGRPTSSLLRVERHVSVGEHRTLRHPRRAPGVLQHGHVIHTHLQLRRIG